MHIIKCYMFVVFGYDKLVSKAQTHADTAKTLPYFKRKKTQIVFLDIQSSGFRFGQIFKIWNHSHTLLSLTRIHSLTFEFRIQQDNGKLETSIEFSVKKWNQHFRILCLVFTHLIKNLSDEMLWFCYSLFSWVVCVCLYAMRLRHQRYFVVVENVFY